MKPKHTRQNGEPDLLAERNKLREINAELLAALKLVEFLISCDEPISFEMISATINRAEKEE